MVLVFANGEMPTVEWARRYCAEAEGIIAADGGLRHLLALGVWPDIVIGDMDSLPAGSLEQLGEQGVRIVRHPHAKDETDLELALILAAEAFPGTSEILVCGALGGRLDQTFANILLLVHPALADRRVVLLTEFQRAWIIGGTAQIEGQVGDRVSLIPLGGDAVVASTENLRWPLHNERLLFGPARGVSNVMLAEHAVVSVGAGLVLCVHTDVAWTR